MLGSGGILTCHSAAPTGPDKACRFHQIHNFQLHRREYAQDPRQEKSTCTNHPWRAHQIRNHRGAHGATQGAFQIITQVFFPTSFVVGFILLIRIFVSLCLFSGIACNWLQPESMFFSMMCCTLQLAPVSDITVLFLIASYIRLLAYPICFCLVYVLIICV